MVALHPDYFRYYNCATRLVFEEQGNYNLRLTESKMFFRVYFRIKLVRLDNEIMAFNVL